MKRVLFIFLLLLPACFGSALMAQWAKPRKVQMIIFADFSDSYCKAFFQTTYKSIQQAYGDRVQFVLKHFPSHQRPEAILASEALACATDQGKLWPYAEAVAANPADPDKEFLLSTADGLGLNKESFQQCLDSGKKRVLIDKDIHEGVRLGLRGTPSFFVEGDFVEGSAPFNTFRALLDKHLQMATRAPIKVDVVYDENFKLDDPQKYYSFLKTYYLPESEINLISQHSASGQRLIKEFGVRALPAFVISRGVENSPQFNFFKALLEQKKDAYLLRPEAYEGILQFFEAPAYDKHPMLGDPKARVTIMEFSDFQCPICARFSRTVLPKLKEKYLGGGVAKFVFRNFPLKMHDQAEEAAVASECTRRAGLFWKYHDVLFQNQDKLDRYSLIKYAQDLGQEPKSFVGCLDSAEARAAVQRDLEVGAKFAVAATPTLLINNFRVSTTDLQLIDKLIKYAMNKPLAKAQ